MIHGLIAAIGIGLVVAVVFAIWAARTALVAEENYQAFFHAERATIEFMEQNGGQWPKSWDDLQSVHPESDFDWVADHVTFDFHADPSELAVQTLDTFTAISPHQPCYIITDKVQNLIDASKKHHDPSDVLAPRRDP